MIRRLSIGLLTGCVITALPWLASKMNHEALWPVNVLDIPGVFVAMMLSGWNVHDYSYPALVIGNIGFYALLVYGYLRLANR